MKTDKLRNLLLAAAVVLAGCEQATTPDGTPSEVSVRAYVDLDGSGSFTAGDLAVSGATIRLLPTDGGSAIEAETDAEGQARFTGVAPGSYTASLQGTVPQGAELAGTATPVVVAPFSGGQVSAQFRYVFYPGTIQGRLLRSGDSVPAPQVLVRLYAGAQATGTPVDSARTSVQGEFGFSMVRPGAYTLEIVPLPGITIEGGNTRQLQVGSGQQMAVSVGFTGTLRIDIAALRPRAAQGDSSTVIVEGVATVGSAPFNGTIYVQDATGGVMAFLAAGATVNQGERVRVSGPLGHFGNELQIGRTNPRASVAVLGAGIMPAPRVVTGAQMLARTYEGELATARMLTVTAVGGNANSTAYSVTAEAEDGSVVTVRVQHANVAIPQPFWAVGSTYDVTGLLGSFNGAVQLKPRSPADVVASTGAGTPIGTLRQRAAGGDSSQVVVQGVATVGTGILGGTTTTTLYVQDASGGVMVFAPTGITVATGQRIRVTGVLGHFGRELQIGTSASRAQVEVLGAGTLPAPRLVTGVQIVARTFEGQLGRVENVEVTNVPGGTGAAFDVTVRHPDGEQFIVRVMGAGTGLTRANFVVGQRYDVVGLVGSFNDAPQLKPRSAADVVVRP
jgi:hypothetical protein